MPSGRDWVELVRATFHSVGRDDFRRLKREWRGAKAKLTVGEHDAIAREPRRLRRFLKSANAVLYGLSKRLAPARRVVFGGVLLCILLSIQGPTIVRESDKVEGGVRKTSEYSIHFDNFYLMSALVLLGFLLAMELVDKINYRDELELARELQASLIPRELPQTGAYELAADSEVANMVGGDIYDFVPVPGGRLAVLFGDASGHGMAAGLVMAVAHAAFRTQLDVDPAPTAMFATLNRILCRTGNRRAFFGCVYLLLSEDGSFAGSVAGHPLPIRVGPDGTARERIGKGAYPLGIKVDLSWRVEEGRLEAGEILFLHSDGLSEARNAAGQDFGDSRIEAAIRRAAGQSAPALVEEVTREVRAFRGDEPPEDDVSVAVVRRKA
jgi:sigma-B regulation protein RsbU (phosphoserine phosphatase)